MEAAHRLLVFGGALPDGSLSNDLYELTLGARAVWRCCACSGRVPQARWAHSAVLHADQMYVSTCQPHFAEPLTVLVSRLVFGGLAEGGVLSEIMSLHTRTMKWELIEPRGQTIPGPRHKVLQAAAVILVSPLLQVNERFPTPRYSATVLACGGGALALVWGSDERGCEVCWRPGRCCACAVQLQIISTVVATVARPSGCGSGCMSLQMSLSL